MLEGAQILEVGETSISDLCVDKLEMLEGRPREVLDVRITCICYLLAVRQVEMLEGGKVLEMCETSILQAAAPAEIEVCKGEVLQMKETIPHNLLTFTQLEMLEMKEVSKG